MSIKVGINGFGRIGRPSFRQILEDNDFEVVAINDLASCDNLAYLLKYDSAHGVLNNKDVRAEDDYILVDDKKIKVYKIKDPSLIPWDKHEVDVVLECSGVFRTKEKASLHLENNPSLKGVVLSAPGKGGIDSFVYGVNDEKLTKDMSVISAASCTTNCLAPIGKVIDDNYKIKGGFMTTIHAYTNAQSNLDLINEKDFRRGRASAQNIVPTTTGATSALGEVLPSLKGKIKGSAIRVPVLDGSLVELFLELEKKTTVSDINSLFEEKSKKEFKDIIIYNKDEIVSSDILGNKGASIFDSTLTDIVNIENRQYVKLVSWYDNEFGYCAQFLRLTKKFINLKKEN